MTLQTMIGMFKALEERGVSIYKVNMAPKCPKYADQAARMHFSKWLILIIAA